MGRLVCDQTHGLHIWATLSFVVEMWSSLSTILKDNLVELKYRINPDRYLSPTAILWH
ncbi:MAG: hypothetical protein R3C12_21635 [Planctomycetaceae bacterium]